MKKVLFLPVVFICFQAFLCGDTADEYFRQGKQAYEKKEYEQAYMLFEKACGLKPEEAKYHYNFGLAARKTNKYEVALKAFLEAERLDPSISFTNDREGFRSKVDEMYRLSDSARPEDDAYISFADGEAAYKAGDYGLAFTLFQKAVSIQPKSAKYQYNLGLAARKTKQYRISRDAFREAQKLDPAVSFTTKKDDFFEKLEEVSRLAGEAREEEQSPVSEKKRGMSPGLIVLIIIGLVFTGLYVKKQIKKGRAGHLHGMADGKKPIDDDYNDYRSSITSATHKTGRRRPYRRRDYS
ncbi:MAG: tetratricopeptide repeat protein [Spirochaetales bacterium]|nr:tetratricopeptide repeat protein [Spirochaetales bacterium]